MQYRMKRHFIAEKVPNQGFSLVIYQAMSQSTANIRYDPYDAANCKLCARKFESPGISE